MEWKDGSCINREAAGDRINLPETQAMNTTCPFCGEPQRFPVMCMDCMVVCNHCGREFLLSNKPRDQDSAQGWSLPAIQASIDAIFWTAAILGVIAVYILLFLL